MLQPERLAKAAVGTCGEGRVTELGSAESRHENHAGVRDSLPDIAYQSQPIIRRGKGIGEDYPKGLLCQHRVGFCWTQHGLSIDLLTCQKTL
jgi:hypothetical protein